MYSLHPSLKITEVEETKITILYQSEKQHCGFEINTQLGLLKFLRHGWRHGFIFACIAVRWMINESGRQREKKISHYSLFERLGIKGGINSLYCGYTQLKRSIHLSVHPFPSTYPRLGCVPS